MFSKEDTDYMKRALRLSQKGAGFVNPNPLVGALVVRNGQILGEGYHRAFGKAHAEVNAIEHAGGDCFGATLFVTLEPCNHQGKTPPCTDRIIREKFKRVVIGMKDPNPDVTGGGVERLREAGIVVESGLLEDRIRKTNEHFIKYCQTQRPFLALKTAMTLDGKIATRTGSSRWITGAHSRKFVHTLRHRYAAILVGVDTVIADDPELTDRSVFSIKSNPLRIVVDSSGRTPLKSKVFNTESANTLFAVTVLAGKEKITHMKAQGCEVWVCPEDAEGKVDLVYLMQQLGKRGIDSVLLEGGGTLNYSAIRAEIVDKVYAFVAPKIVGGQAAPGPVGGLGIQEIGDAFHWEFKTIKRFGEDLLVEAYPKI